eukprot:COSAG02_NODE_817_length_16825_cov_49.127646_4_plen_125_part_00
MYRRGDGRARIVSYLRTARVRGRADRTRVALVCTLKRGSDRVRLPREGLRRHAHPVSPTHSAVARAAQRVANSQQLYLLRPSSVTTSASASASTSTPCRSHSPAQRDVRHGGRPAVPAFLLRSQ